MGDSLGTCGGPWCVRGPHDGTGDEATLILTPPPPLSLDLHPGFTHFYLFTHSHHIHSFSGLIAPHPKGTLTCEACHQPPAHPSRPPLERQISKTRRYTNVVCCPDMLNAIVSLSCLVNSIQCTAFYGPTPPPPPSRCRQCPAVYGRNSVWGCRWSYQRVHRRGSQGLSECCKVGYSATLARVHVHRFICSENRGNRRLPSLGDLCREVI